MSLSDVQPIGLHVEPHDRLFDELRDEAVHQREMADSYRRIARRWEMSFWVVAPGAITSVVLLVVCHVGQ